MKQTFLIPVLLLAMSSYAAQKYAASGMILSVDQTRRSFVASCQAIPGFMDAMSMPFEVRDSKELTGLIPGTLVEFTLVIDRGVSYAEHVQIRRYQTVEQDPWSARQLKLLSRLTGLSKSTPPPLEVGRAVPDFTLIDQGHERISLSQFAGKVVALNFIYTSCALPQYCFRSSNNFGTLQRRFRDRLGRDLVLLTVTFDPQRDNSEVLAHYSQTWKADPKTWHFLTGPVPDVGRVADIFGMEFFPDEGLMDHSLHTAIIGRDGRLIANIEGNRFTAKQLVDLIDTVLSERHEQGENMHVARNAESAPP